MITPAENEFNMVRAKFLNEAKYISVATFIKSVGITRKTFKRNVLPSLQVLRLGPRKTLINLSEAQAWIQARTEIISANQQEDVEWDEDDDDY